MSMQVVLLESTPNATKLVYTAARQCYSDTFAGEDYFTTYPEGTEEGLLNKVMGMGHLSVLEHASFTFAIEGISRVASHQLVRFRVASYSQQSQRYVKGPFGFVIPPSIENAGTRVKARFLSAMISADTAYQSMIDDGIPAEDARFLLPNATETKLLMTMNARELLHACGLRCCVHAQWEIRDMFNEIKKILQLTASVLFRKIGAPCETHGTCPEGPRSCGKIKTLAV